MRKNMISLFIGGLALYLCIKWFPTVEPFNFSVYFSVLIFNPVKFFTGSMAFLISFLFLSNLVKSFIIQIRYIFINRKRFSFLEFLSSLFICFIPLWLIQLSFWLLLTNLLIATLYGIFTLDIKREYTRDQDL